MTPPDVQPEQEKEPEQELKPAKAPLRFTYPSGSRPLDGYQIKRGVGRGGFGEVYFAVSDAGKEVALKLIRRNLDVEVRGVTQCLNLKHQNLVALYDIRNDEHDDRWVVMEYVSGDALDDAIARHPDGMPLELAMSWFSGIAAGVAYLHDHGIVHRDLKPANIFLDEDIVKIGDYGLSKFISCSRRSGQTESVGTVHYMAPEISNGRYGKEIDTYALGIILFEMLTGHVPFEGESVGEVLMKHLTAEPDLSVLDEPYRGIVRGAMAKDPETRIQNVAEMLNRLPGLGSVPRFPTAAEAASPSNPQFTNSPRPQSPRPGEFASADGVILTPVEPIADWFQTRWNYAKHNFGNSPLPPFVKAIILIAITYGLLITFTIWGPLLLVLAFVYLVYLAIRAIVMPPATTSSTTAQVKANGYPAAAPAPQAGNKRVPMPDEVPRPPKPQSKRRYGQRRRKHWQQSLQDHVAAKPIRLRVTELIGSMIAAAVISCLLSLLGCAIVSGNTISLEFYLWMSIVATLGSWAIMIPAKLAEGRVEDQAPLRFGLLIAGALVGFAAFAMSDLLRLHLPISRQIGIAPWDTLAHGFFGVDSGKWETHHASGSLPVTLAATTAYFAFLFIALRWWRSTDYTRSSRVSFWSISVCIFAGFMMSFVWWFPQPLGAVLAGMIAFTTQLSSPWMPPSKRRQLAEEGA